MSDDWVIVRFSRELVEQMADYWSPPVECRLVRRENGEYDLLARTVPPHVVAEPPEPPEPPPPPPPADSEIRG